MAQMAEKFLLSRLSRAGFVMLALIALLTGLWGNLLTAITAAAAASLVFTGTAFHPGRAESPWPAIHLVVFCVFMALLLSSLWAGPWSLAH